MVTEEWKKVVENRIDSLGRRMEDLEGKILDNTNRIQTIDRNTSEVVDILRDWKGAMRVLKFTAKVIAPLGILASAAAAVAAFLGWHK